MDSRDQQIFGYCIVPASYCTKPVDESATTNECPIHDSGTKAIPAGTMPVIGHLTDRLKKIVDRDMERKENI